MEAAYSTTIAYENGSIKNTYSDPAKINLVSHTVYKYDAPKLRIRYYDGGEVKTIKFYINGALTSKNTYSVDGMLIKHVGYQEGEKITKSIFIDGKMKQTIEYENDVIYKSIK